ncbi:MAG: carboxypeptidase-like regulatory domain-containing protein, partial [Terracidiphilus sp.]
MTHRSPQYEMRGTRARHTLWRWVSATCALFLLLTLTRVGAFAQANSELTGIVTDTTGAVIPGASIVLTDPATAYTRATTSGSTGLYDFAGLNPANYNLTVTARGF